MLKTLIAAGALAAYFILRAAPSTAAGPELPQLLPSAVTIHIQNFMFVPATATIHAGDRVTFVNDDSEAHTATSNDKSFDSEGIDSAGRWQHVFAKPGTITYFCELHPYMKATLIVLPAPSAAHNGDGH